MSGFSEIVKRLEEEYEAAATLADIADRFPHLVLSAAESISGGSPDRSHYEMVRDFLAGQDGPVATADIERATKLSQSAIRSVLYGDRSDEFESVPYPGHSTRRKWRLKTGGVFEVRSAARVTTPGDGLMGPTEAIRQWFAENPQGGISGDIVRAVQDRVRSTSDDKNNVLHSVLASLEKRGKIRSITADGVKRYIPEEGANVTFTGLFLQGDNVVRLSGTAEETD